MNLLQALELETIVKCRQLGEYEPPNANANALSRAVWRYRCILHPYTRKVAAAVFLAVSLCIIWSEATIFTGRSPDLSPFSTMIRLADGTPTAWGLDKDMHVVGASATRA